MNDLENTYEDNQLSTNNVISKKRVTEVLKKRARFYAKPRGDIRKEVALKRIVVFSLSGELYGIEVDEIKEVFYLDSLTTLPGTPSFLKGIVNVRGKIVPVIDLKSFFQLADSGISDLNKVIILENEQYELGLLADFIKTVEEVDFKLLEPPLPVLTDIRANYTKGLIDGIIILSVSEIVNDKKLIIDDK